MEDVQDGILTSFQQNHANLRCRYCDMRGHMSDTCWKRLADLEKKTKASSGNTKGDSTSTGKDGWFKEVRKERKETKRGVSGFQVDLEKKAWLQDEE